MMIQKIRNSKAVKWITVFVAVNMLGTLVLPYQAFALTSGPTTPEVQSFEPISTNQMVDLFTGDFNYNIPLFNLPGPDGGYPFNLAYHAGIGMDQEASWVGLGWNINAGALNRQLNNLPDEFDGDIVNIKRDMKPNVTAGLSFVAGMEAFGAKLGDFFGGNLSASSYYNNYKGYGFRLTPGINMNFGESVDLGLKFPFDTYDGVGANASLSYKWINKTETKRFTAGLSGGLNTRSGLADYSLNCSWSKMSYGLVYTPERKVQVKTVKAQMEELGLSTPDAGLSDDGPGSRTVTHPAKLDIVLSSARTWGGQSSLSYSNMAFSPSAGMVTRGVNLGIQITGGSSNLGAYNYIGGSGFFNSSWLYKRGDDLPFPTYGYMHMGSDMDNGLSDMAWEKEDILRKQSPNAAIPRYTHDVYQVVGQGIGHMFRPYMSNIGMPVVREEVSKSYGGNIGVELGLGTGAHIGTEVGYNQSKTKNRAWTKLNKLSDDGLYLNEADWYFQTYGEHTSEPVSVSGNDIVLNEAFGNKAIHSEQAAHFVLEGSSNKYFDGNATLKSKLKTQDGTETSFVSANLDRSAKKRKAANVIPFTIKEIMGGPDGSRKEVLPEYDISYFDGPPAGGGYNLSSLKPYERDETKGSHFAGFTTLSTGGMRYVYALPAYNNSQEEYLFTIKGSDNRSANAYFSDYNDESGYEVDNTDKFLTETTTPKYAYSHLLTSVLGTDYVDYDKVRGPSDGDLGYWVKFNYAKADGSYKWKAPYRGFNRVKGKNTSQVDDKGSYLYGNKEVYYLATAETKTHIAEFNIVKREDARGANEQHHDNDAPNGNAAYSYVLESISIYLKNERYKNGNFNAQAVPLQTHHFEYDYQLCKGVHNSSMDGKLTLTKYFVTHKNNQRGALSKYEFEYNLENEAGGYKYEYDPACIDRWGNYKPKSASNEDDYNIQHPYVDQVPTDVTMTNTKFKQIQDDNAAAWCLSRIKLPSGGDITVEYESDDYAYVQNRVAMQMFKIAGLSTVGHSTISDFKDDKYRKILFKLENPVSTQNPAEAEKYVSVGENVFFKIFTDLSRKKYKVPHEYISGYAEVENCGIHDTKDATGLYDHGYVTIRMTDIDNNPMEYHPFGIRAWHYIRSQAPELIGGRPRKNEFEKTKKKTEKVSIVMSLLKAFDDVGVVFRGYYGNMAKHDYGRNLDLNESFIRLRTPDLAKLGGGHRVKKVALNDNWTTDGTEALKEKNNVYGQVYDYTIYDEDRKQYISSGVAQNEPGAGGEESALRIVKPYVERVPMTKNNNLYFEYPINENLLPAASVGYRQVTVKSLATYNAEQGTITTNSTTGKTVNEFFTAKEFPVVSYETQLNKDTRFSNWLVVPLPFIGMIEEKKLTVSQGYSTVLNDMHGKLKGVKSYGQKKDGSYIDQVVSSVEYVYKTKEDFHPDFVNELDNIVEVIEHDDVYSNEVTNWDGKKLYGTKIAQHQMGVDYDFYIGTKEDRTFALSCGLSHNVEVLAMIPAPTIWPSYSHNLSRLRMAVTNKVIHKSGIVDRVITYDGKATREAQNVYFDEFGTPLLTTTTNDYDNTVYSYSIPARWEYEGMGAAYQTLEDEYTCNIATEDASNFLYKADNSNSAFNAMKEHMFEGDEVIVTLDSDKKVHHKLTLIRKYATKLIFAAEENLGLSAATKFNFRTVRSGKRNHLATMAQSVVAFNNPITTRALNEHADGDIYHHYLSIDNVLGISAQTFRDQWLSKEDLTSQATHIGTHVNSKNPYSTGEKGVWGPWQSYVYVDDRTQTAKNVDLENDGVLNGVPFFQWNSYEFQSSNGTIMAQDKRQNWKFVSEGTSINSSSYTTEEVNAMKIYSAALYCFDGRMNLANANNAKEREIGFENFEDYTSKSSITCNSASGSNIDIYNIWTAHNVWDRYRINNSLIPDGHYEFADAASSANAKLSAEAYRVYNATTKELVNAYEGVTNNVTITAVSPTTNALTFTQPTFSDGNYMPRWRGSIAIERPGVVHNSVRSNSHHLIHVSDARAHTGSKSLYIAGDAKFAQNSIKPEPGESYVMSLWVSPESKTAAFTSSDLGVTVKFIDKQGNYVGTQPTTSDMQMKGQMIEGWQLVEFEFDMPSNAYLIQLEFDHKPGKNMFVDDLRIHPSDAIMSSYVYGQDDLKLHAALDANNYATFYYYNEDGSLFLVKCETADGIITVMESRGYSIQNQ